jgi:hypothetical protein
MLPHWTLIGFTGHRRLTNPDLIAEHLASAIDQIAARCSTLAAISSAAAGADTIFVEEVSERRLPFFLLLPFDTARFEKDFTAEQWRRIQPYFAKAVQVEQITGEATENQAYLETGLRTVDRANVVIAVWDGKPAAGQGGTGDVVAYARALEKPLVWINSGTGEILTERFELLPQSQPPVDLSTSPRHLVANHFAGLDAAAKLHGPKARYMIQLIILLQLASSIPDLITLAIWRGAAGSVVDTTVNLWEIILLFTSLLLINRHRRNQGQWLKNRIEAEICRSALATWRIPLAANHPTQLALKGFDRLCANLALMRQLDRSAEPDLNEVRCDYLENRVKDQIHYFTQFHHSARRAFNRMRAGALLCTWIAFAAACFQIVSPIVHTGPAWEKLLRVSSLVLPLFSAAFFSLIVTREYSRRSERYREMVEILDDAARRLALVQTWNGLARIAAQVEEELLQEIVEWHSYTRFAGEAH